MLKKQQNKIVDKPTNIVVKFYELLESNKWILIGYLYRPFLKALASELPSTAYLAFSHVSKKVF